MRMKLYRSTTLFLLLSVILTGCFAKQQYPSSFHEMYSTAEQSVYTAIEEEAVALSESPEAALFSILEPVADGTHRKSCEKADIDYSNTTDGYVMVRNNHKTSRKYKVQLQGPSTTYTYNLTEEDWTVFPLSDGNGTYKVTVFENVTGSKYALVLSVSFKAELADEFAPFLRPNQYVNYTADSAVVLKAIELTEKSEKTLEKVEAVYNYVVNTLEYDKEKAKNVKSGYLPVLDDVLASQKGICFDYASLMAGMLRSQNIPCKLVVGYAGNSYHAWINVWTDDSGWIDGVVFFDGSAWHRMDPTYASSANKSESIMKYIGNGENYTAKYLY